MKKYIWSLGFVFLLCFPRFMIAPLFPNLEGKIVITREPRVYQPETLTDLCLGRCSALIMENETSHLYELFKHDWKSEVNTEVKEQLSLSLLRTIIKEFERDLNEVDDNFRKVGDPLLQVEQRREAKEKFDSLVPRMFERLEEEDPAFIKNLAYRFLFHLFFGKSGHFNKRLYRTAKIRARRNIKNFLVSIVSDTEEQRFLQTYFEDSNNFDLPLYKKDPYYVAFKQRNFIMMDKLRSYWGSGYSEKYYIKSFSDPLTGFEKGVYKSWWEILKDETDPNDAEMKDFLKERLGIEFK